MMLYLKVSMSSLPRSPMGLPTVASIVEASDTVAPGTFAFAFGWGNPADPRPVREKGSNVQVLTSAESRYDSVTGLALQSAIPANVRRIEPHVPANE